MSEIKILIEGYAKEEKTGWKASSTTVLIKDNGLNILVDPGLNRQLLLKAFAKERLKPKDIDLIFITHYHPDHIFNIRLFQKQDILDGDTIYKKDEEIIFSDRIPDTNIQVIQTPGHAHEHASLIVKTDKGKIAVAGDLFWWKDNEKQKTDCKSLIEKEDPFMKNKEDLINSRKKILEIADYIIPGHGKMFKVKK